ncbi:uncharacterized protein LOC111718320 isoform X2 [Eurytemora carolleeae]|uniref:uncharacterized protein LOC111718320 isoform X2 n=1 Tax=Eurytemora carolleeae TaxID=1294199 RepID=UPI000C7878B3|nr:uncharacterized protein LOC111718320 isoform X2 [Eurytemora carolleeae]|eukprot:XP_023349651.1 uncharacterized protein LOC111718320 isoform X2 [Eurytemora affinis]
MGEFRRDNIYYGMPYSSIRSGGDGGEYRRPGVDSSIFLDNFYSNLPQRPSSEVLTKLHRPSSSYSNLSSPAQQYSPNPSSYSSYSSSSAPRPYTGLRRASSQNDLQMGLSSTMERSSSNNNLSRPNSSLRRSYKNTHNINGFYQKPSDDKNDEFFTSSLNSGSAHDLHNDPRFGKSDSFSFFNGLEARVLFLLLKVELSYNPLLPLAVKLIKDI